MKNILFNIAIYFERIILQTLFKIPVVARFLKKNHSLKLVAFTATTTIAFISFNTAYLITSAIYSNYLKDHASNTAKAISSSINLTLPHLMLLQNKKEAVETFINTLNSTYSELPFKVAIYKTRFVSSDKQEQTVSETIPGLKTAITTGQMVTTTADAYLLEHFYPIKADKVCIRCHSKAIEGDVLAVVAFSFDLAPTLKSAKSKIAWTFFVLLPVPIFLIAALYLLLNAKLSEGIRQIIDKIQGINKITDLTNLKIDNSNVGFSEFNALVSELNTFAKRIKAVAVDKEMLEFEIRLLERFIITSDVVKDWKEHVMNLLVELNKLIEAYALFSVFQIDDEIYDLEVFWYITPSQQSLHDFEQIIKECIASKGAFKYVNMQIFHNIAFTHNTPRDINKDAIMLQTKSLFLQTPQIGGVVGIGVQADVAEDTIKSLVIDGALTTLINVVGSIKAIYKYTRDLEYYATRDPLTNLYNQRIFWELLGYEINRAQRHNYKFSVLVIDLDNFKIINDTYGHSFGDKYLRAVADTIHSAIRQGDILGRYGGDEFALVLPEADEEQAYAVAERIRLAIDQLFVQTADKTAVKATVSIGFAVYPVHATTAKDLFTFADTMMYKAKSKGKNTTIVPSQVDIAEVFKKTSEIMLKIITAIEQNDIEPHFLPIVDLQLPNEILGYEVLGRIKVSGDIISAREFIEIAEKTGTVAKFDQDLIQQVFKEVHLKGFAGKIFINLSAKTLIIKDFIPFIVKAAKHYLIDPSKVVFEVAEQDIVKNVSILEKFVAELSIEGFGFAIDRFGSGFSSLLLLKRIPTSYLKISGQLLKNALSSEIERAFLKSIVLFSNDAQIVTIAKSIETEALAQLAKQIGFKYGQGFYFAKSTAGALR